MLWENEEKKHAHAVLTAFFKVNLGRPVAPLILLLHYS